MTLLRFTLYGPLPALRLRFKPALPNDPSLALFVIWRNAFAASHVALIANIRAFARMVEADMCASDEDTQPLERIAV